MDVWILRRIMNHVKLLIVSGLLFIVYFLFGYYSATRQIEDAQ